MTGRDSPAMRVRRGVLGLRCAIPPAKKAFGRRRGERGSSLLEAAAAAAIAALALGGAARQVSTACTTVREAREVSAAMTAARNVLETALATPCASVQNAVSACTGGFQCTITGHEIARRTDATGTVVLLHLNVEVTTEDGSSHERKLARLASIAARPEACA